MGGDVMRHNISPTERAEEKGTRGTKTGNRENC